MNKIFLKFVVFVNGVSYFWIGGNDRLWEGSWYWDEGDVIYYINWDKGKRIWG